VAETSGVRLLDVHSDPDHNRSVLTFAGEPGSLVEAAYNLSLVAVREIDLTRHQGVHPRMGAIDVIPFVYLDESRRSDCVSAAVTLGRRIGEDLDIPVYLYGDAARPGRPVTLIEIRGRGFEALRARGDGLIPPDFGPQRLHPTGGAVAVGARPPLLAFNVMLRTADVAAARRVARRVRASTGGLPRLQAIGLQLQSRGVAQVSMNLLDYELTGLAAVMAAVRAAAEAEGVSVGAAELVGLMPREALNGTEADGTPGMPTEASTVEHRLR
jgi:glutamate formiminotransferase